MMKLKYLLVRLLLFFGIILVLTQNTVLADLDADLSETEKETFNAIFTAYAGTDISGVKVKQLIQSVITSNTNQKSMETDRFVTIKYNNTIYGENGENIEISDILSSNKYTVSVNYDSTTGYVNNIEINKIDDFIEVEDSTNISDTSTNSTITENEEKEELLYEKNEESSNETNEKLPDTGIESKLVIVAIITMLLGISKYLNIKIKELN